MPEACWLAAAAALVAAWKAAAVATTAEGEVVEICNCGAAEKSTRALLATCPPGSAAAAYKAILSVVGV